MATDQQRLSFGLTCITPLLVCILLHATVSSAAEEDEAPTFDGVDTGPGQALVELIKEAIVGCYADEANEQKVTMTEAGFEGILRPTGEPLHETKCLRYCLMRHYKMLDKDNQFDVEGMIDFLEKLHENGHNDDERKRLKERLQHCRAEAMEQTDRCERAHVASACILKRLNG